MKKRYLIQEYINTEDFDNGCNVLCLDGYTLHSFHVIGDDAVRMANGAVTITKLRIYAVFHCLPAGRSRSMLDQNMESLSQ